MGRLAELDTHFACLLHIGQSKQPSLFTEFARILQQMKLSAVTVYSREGMRSAYRMGIKPKNNMKEPEYFAYGKSR